MLAAVLGSPTRRNAKPVTSLLRTPTSLGNDPWIRVARELRIRVSQPAFGNALTELSEWFWDGCLEESCDASGAALLRSPLAKANFEALAMLDTSGRHGRSAAVEMLEGGTLDAIHAKVLREAIDSRPELYRVEHTSCGERRQLMDLESGKLLLVDPDAWPVKLVPGNLIVGRLIGVDEDARWIGPVYPFPAGTPEEVLLDVRQGLADLARAHPIARAAATERFLVDLHHQWFFHVLVPAHGLSSRLAEDAPKAFTLLAGRMRTSG
ncbi:MAG: hypothetical protein ACI8QC_000332 [Planctomycetota bacterium]|jgi:hypothetical protein